MEDHNVLTRNCNAIKETCISYGSTYHLVGDYHTGACDWACGMHMCLWISCSFLGVHLPHPFCVNTYSTAGRSLSSALCPGEGPPPQLLSHCAQSGVSCPGLPGLPCLPPPASTLKLLRSLHSKTCHRARLQGCQVQTFKVKLKEAGSLWLSLSLDLSSVT